MELFLAKADAVTLKCPSLLSLAYNDIFLSQSEAYITKQVQHTQDIFSLSDFTEPIIGCPDNQYYEAGHQPAQSTWGFPIQLWARSCERGGGCNYERHRQSHE